MIAKLMKARRSGKSRRRASYRLFAERLEERRLLVHDTDFVTLEFDTSLESLNLSGGPYPMPLASDPGNTLGDSVAGYGFVNTLVTITLSSQRPANATPPGPGPDSLGKACAFLSRPNSDAEGISGCRGEVENGPNPGGEPQEINPAELDGHQFFVNSFFDVFFDITVTDVDERPGRDFAGQGPGASFLLPNNGPAHMQSLYNVIFDADAPNFGIVPPPEVSPYIGHFNIEIPLGGDINGNGQNDKIKFTLASHAAGDENRTFTTLPNGTVIDEFDSAAFLEGAVVDVSTDPPFTLGAGSAGAPSFSGAGALIGPTTANSTLLNPIANAGFSFVDADNNKLFIAGIDVVVDNEVADGKFDTDVPEGGYTTPIPGAGMYLGGAPISVKNIAFKADGNVVVNTDLTATGRGHGGGDGGGDLALISRAGSIRLDDPSLTAHRDVVIQAAVDFVSTDDMIDAERDVRLAAGALIELLGTGVKAGRDIGLDGGSVNTGGNGLNAGRDVDIKARDAIFAEMATIEAKRDIKMTAGLGIDLDDAMLTAGRDIDVNAGDNVSIRSAKLKAGKEINIEGDKVIRNGMTVLMAKKVKVKERT